MDPVPFQPRYSVIMRHYPFYRELNASLPNASGQGSHLFKLPKEDEVCVGGITLCTQNLIFSN